MHNFQFSPFYQKTVIGFLNFFRGIIFYLIVFEDSGRNEMSGSINCDEVVLNCSKIAYFIGFALINQ